MAPATEDDELAAAVHRVLASLADLRSATPEVRRGRLLLVRWLRQELSAVEALLTGAADRPGDPGSTGTVTPVDRR